jgi:hypothetical protein
MTATKKMAPIGIVPFDATRCLSIQSKTVRKYTELLNQCLVYHIEIGLFGWEAVLS